MREILVLLFWLMLFAGIGFIITYVFTRIFKNKWVRLIPSFLAIIFIVYSLYRMLNATEGFEDLGYFLMLLFFACSLVGTFIAYFIRRKK